MGVFAERLTLTFTDGTSAEVASTQIDVASAEVQAAALGIFPPRGTLLLAAYPVLATRLRGWAAYRRTTSPRLTWQEFDVMVEEVTAHGEPEPDPTRTGTSAESSPPSPPEQA